MITSDMWPRKLERAFQIFFAVYVSFCVSVWKAFQKLNRKAFLSFFSLPCSKSLWQRIKELVLSTTVGVSPLSKSQPACSSSSSPSPTLFIRSYFSFSCPSSCHLLATFLSSKLLLSEWGVSAYTICAKQIQYIGECVKWCMIVRSLSDRRGSWCWWAVLCRSWII